MGRVRLAVAAVVAVAMMSIGAAACTPEQANEIGTGLVNAIGFILFIHVYGDPVWTAPTTTPDTTPTTTPPVTDPPTTQPT